MHFMHVNLIDKGAYYYPYFIDHARPSPVSAVWHLLSLCLHCKENASHLPGPSAAIHSSLLCIARAFYSHSLPRPTFVK